VQPAAGHELTWLGAWWHSVRPSRRSNGPKGGRGTRILRRRQHRGGLPGSAASHSGMADACLAPCVVDPAPSGGRALRMSSCHTRIACHGKAASPVVGRAVYAFIPEVPLAVR